MYATHTAVRTHDQYARVLTVHRRIVLKLFYFPPCYANRVLNKTFTGLLQYSSDDFFIFIALVASNSCGLQQYHRVYHPYV